MARRWTLEELIDEVQFKVAFNTGQTDQDFIGPSTDTDKHFRNAINEAYLDEYEDGVQTGDPRWWYYVESITWPANQKRLELPAPLRGKWIISMYDTTNLDPGTAIYISDFREGATHFWHDHKTLQWGTNGPSSAKTVQVTYLGEPAEMLDDADEPLLIAPRFRHLIAWSAAIKLRVIGDESAPQEWYLQRDKIRERHLKFLSLRGPIETGGPGIRNNRSEDIGLSS